MSGKAKRPRTGELVAGRFALPRIASAPLGREAVTEWLARSRGACDPDCPVRVLAGSLGRGRARTERVDRSGARSPRGRIFCGSPFGAAWVRGVTLQPVLRRAWDAFALPVSPRRERGEKDNRDGVRPLLRRRRDRGNDVNDELEHSAQYFDAPPGATTSPVWAVSGAATLAPRLPGLR